MARSQSPPMIYARLLFITLETLVAYPETTICYERSGKSDHLQAKA